MPPVLHVCSTGGPQSGASDFRNVPAQDGEEATEVGGLGYVGADGKILIGVWDTADGGLFVPLLWTNVVFHQ